MTADSEFKGFVKAKLEDIEKKIDCINDRLDRLECNTVDNKVALGKVYAVAGVISIFFTALVSFLIKYIWR